MNTFQIAHTTDILSEYRMRQVRYWAEQHIDRLSDRNVNPMYDGRTIQYDAVDDEQIRMSLQQVAGVMGLMVRDWLAVEDNHKLESMMICRWGPGDRLGTHLDNAYWNPDGVGHLAPNYTSWRTYSAIYHLNRDYHGGQLYFHDGMTMTMPDNTAVAFSAGYPHGVHEVISGIRWTVAGWFTDRAEKYHQMNDYHEDNVNAPVIEHLEEALA